MKKIRSNHLLKLINTATNAAAYRNTPNTLSNTCAGAPYQRLLGDNLWPSKSRGIKTLLNLFHRTLWPTSFESISSMNLTNISSVLMGFSKKFDSKLRLEVFIIFIHKSFRLFEGRFFLKIRGFHSYMENNNKATLVDIKSM